MAGLTKTQVQLGDSATATQNFVLTSAAQDGTMKLARGNYGATTQDIMTVDAAGKVVFPQNVVSMIRVNSPNGYGSTNTRVSRFLNGTNGVNGAVIQGADITYTDSATLGASFTANIGGVYAVSWTATFNAGSFFSLTMNDVAAGNLGTTLASGEVVYGGTEAGNVSWTGYLAAGSIIRAVVNTNQGAGTMAAHYTLTMVKVA